MALLWGYALDGEECPVWEVKPNKAGWQLQHVHGARGPSLDFSIGLPSTPFSGHCTECMHMTHSAFVLSSMTQTHFEVSQHQSQDSLLPSPSSLLHRHRDVRDEFPVASNASPSAGHTDLPDEIDAITISDSDASLTDTGVHWDFSSRSSARRIQLTSHLKGIKEEDGAREVATGFPSSDNAEESTVTRYNATVAGLARLCHCLKTPGFPPPRFHFSQLAHLPFEWPMARLSIDFPSVAASFSQNVSRVAVEKTLSGQRLTESWLETTCEQFCVGGHWTGSVSPLLRYFTALALLKCCIDSLRGFIWSLWNFGRRPCTLNWRESVMT